MIIAYPLVIHLGPLTVTGFGIMMALAFAVGGWVIDHETRRNGFAPDYVGDIIVGAVVGGIVGAKLWFVALPGHGVQDLFERSGLVWYGGFIGGALGVVLNGWRRRVPMRWTAQLVAPALAAAYAIGRIGCFVVGDDYGIPSTLPWAVAFPEGAPPTTAANLRAFHVAIPASVAPNTILAVHPTQLYEVFLMTIVFAILWRWRTESRGTGWLFGAYLVLAGIERFAIEFLRAKDDRQPNGFSLAQYASVAVVIVGIIVATQLSKRARTAPGEWLLRGAPEPATRAPKPT